MLELVDIWDSLDVHRLRAVDQMRGYYYETH